ncbi:A-kinase anchor protein 13 [Hyperolius riggenbachi]|uniref:A-kinase anchor protein 13 n=1 Tax=Hyperolius riggenbachi TaxID=752182 RepID=UPI0035A2D708
MLALCSHLLLDKQEDMKLNPKQAPIYGECVLTVHLNKRSKRRADVFYLLFTGSTQRHVASTRRLNAATLQSVAPAHDCCEIVTVSLCASKKGSVVVLAEDHFEFIHDEAFDSAQFLAANATNQQALNFARFLISAQPCPQDVTTLDKKITLAFKSLQLPSGWNVLGEAPLTDGLKQETLLHFAARLGLSRLSKFLLQQPGGKTALTVSNSEGATPARLALERGFGELAHLFSEDSSSGTPLPSDPSHVEHLPDGCVKHHFELNVYILTKKADMVSPVSMETFIEDLCRHIEDHSNCQGTSVKSEQEPQSEEKTHLCHQEAEKYPADKTVDLHSDSNKNKESVNLCSEESCASDKVEELGINVDSEVETVGGDGAMISFAATSKEPKEEEEGTKSIVESEDVSVTHKHIQSFPTVVQPAETLLSGGNPNEEAGMTSAGIVLDHEGLSRIDNLDEEMITTTKKATPDVAPTEAPDKADVLDLNVSVDMGQAMPGYCTSASSTKDTASHTENSEQEMDAVIPLPVNDNQAIESFSNNSSCPVKQSPCLNETEQCDITDPGDSLECTVVETLHCADMHNKEPERNMPSPESESLDQSVDCISLTFKERNAPATTASPENQPIHHDVETEVMFANNTVAVPSPEGQKTEDISVVTKQAMPDLCISSAKTKDIPSNTETDEQDTATAAAHPDNQPTDSSVILDHGMLSPSILEEKAVQCDTVDAVELGQSQDCSATSALDCNESCDSKPTETHLSTSQSERTHQSADNRSAEDRNVMEADLPECLVSDCVENTRTVLEKDAVIGSAPSPPQGTLDAETPSLDECVEEESGGIASQAEDGSEVLEVSRALLHPITEESLPSSDSSSDNAPRSSENEVCSVLSDSEKSTYPEQQIGGQGMSQSPDTEDYHIQQIAAAIVNAMLDSTVKLCMKEMVNAGSGMPANEGTPCSSAEQPDSLESKEDYEQDTGEHAHVLKEQDSGLDISINMEEAQCPSMSDTEIASAESFDGRTEDEVDFVKHLINRDNCCSLTPCPHPDLLESKQPEDSKAPEQFLEDGLETEHSLPQTLKRESSSYTDLCFMPPEVLDEMVFTKLEEEQSLCDVSSLGSDDNTSLERNSSHGSDISIPRPFIAKKARNRHSMDSSCSSTVTASVDEQESETTGVTEMEEEEMDNITEVSLHSTCSKVIRASSPPRRHSWEPWKHAPSDREISRRSSLRILGNVVKKPATHKRSMSWCPSSVHFASIGEVNCRSYSLEGLAGKTDSIQESSPAVSSDLTAPPDYEGDARRGSSRSLSEEKPEYEQRKNTGLHHEDREKIQPRGFVYSSSGFAPHLTKSVSLTTISNPLVEIQTRIRPKRRISFSFNISPLIPKPNHVFTVGSSSSDDESDSSQSLTRNSLAQSIPEESCDLSPLSPQKELDLKGGTKVSRTFSYLKNKMSGGKKTKEKEKERDKTKEKDKEPKDKDKKTINGHVFSPTPTVGPITCNHCTKNFNKDAYLCASCNSIVHKGCRENFAPCAKVKMKPQKVLQPNDSSSLPTVVMRNKGSQPKERPRSAIVAPDDITFTSISFTNRRPQTTISISKSISTQNIAGVGCDDNILGTWRALSQSTDSLHKIGKVTESIESLVDEELYEVQLMGEFEADSKLLEAESWSQTVDSKFLKQQKKEVVKRQDVIYELMQTEMHHVRTLKIMSDVYYRGMASELHFEQQVLERIFPCIDDLLGIHTHFFQRILDRKKESMVDRSEKNFVIQRIGDILVSQFSGESAEHMKRTYGKFCGHHNEAVNYFKDLLSKEKKFQAFIKKKGSSTLVRRLGIPECILLVTQRITKYPVLLQRILQCTKDNEVEYQEVERALSLVKDVITEVNNKVNNYEKKKRLHDIYSKTDSKSIQRMKSGQMFAKEDLKRRKLVRDGTVFLRSSPASRIKEVLAVLLADVLVFLQEKDQKYIFATLEQKSTVVSLKKLIVRKVAHDEKGLFLISTVGKDPELVEVLTNTKEERDSWIDTIQNTMTTMDKDEDEGVPSESEEEKKNWDTKATELRATVNKHTGQLHSKDEQIIALLEEKEKLFEALTLCSYQEENLPSSSVAGRTLFRANTEEAPRGEPLIKSAIKEVETLEVLVNQYLWSSLVAQDSSELENGVGPVSLPRRAETFGGFDSHQLNASKSGEKDEGEDAQDLRRTESDSVLKKGVHPSVATKRNGMQVLLSVSNLHKCLKSLQAVVVQQDTFIEDQKFLLGKGSLTRHSRPNSLNEQEKQRSLEKLRQNISNLEKQQAQHKEEKHRNESQWETREKKFSEWKEWSSKMDETVKKSMQDVEQKKHRLEILKALGQCDMEGLEEEMRQEKVQEQRNKDPKQVTLHHDKLTRVPSLPVGMDSTKWCDSNSTKQEQLQAEPSTSPKKDSFLLRTDSKQKGKGHFNLLGSQSNKSAEGHSSNRLFNLSKPKEKKDKKKKGKGASPLSTDSNPVEGTTEEEEIFC